LFHPGERYEFKSKKGKRGRATEREREKEEVGIRTISLLAIDLGERELLTSFWCSGEQKYIQSIPAAEQEPHFVEVSFPHTTHLP